MTTDQIISILERAGRYVYCPSEWSDENDTALKFLMENGIIRPSTTKEEGMNADYVYRFTKDS